MSFNVSFLLLLVLLCSSLHACNARRLAGYNTRADDNLHVHNPNEEKRVSVGASKVESQQSTTTTSEAINGGDQVQKNKEKNLTAERNGKKDSVAWKVPHNKHEEKHPGFNLDYSPPKTHPPSHN